VAFWTTKFRRNVARDAGVAKSLKRAGWKALVIWECELRKPKGVERKLRRFLNA
jgi:DNA mismatch endonuclease (patch repair protein)